MRNESEKIGIHKVVLYPKECYCLHYKGKPFSLSKLSYQEQRELGVQYPSIGSISRKVYFTEGYAKTGIKQLPKYFQDKVQIVKYVPETFNSSMNEMPLFSQRKEKDE